MHARRGSLLAAAALTLAGMSSAHAATEAVGPPAVVGALLAASHAAADSATLNTTLPASLRDSRLAAARAHAAHAWHIADLALARERDARALLAQPLAASDPSLHLAAHKAAKSNVSSATRTYAAARLHARAAEHTLDEIDASYAASLGDRGATDWNIYGAQLWQNYLARVAAADINWPTDDAVTATGGLRTVHDALGALRVIPRSAVLALTYAFQQIGKPYKFGATGPNQFDCSGLTQAAYAAAGVPIPRTAAEQWSVLHPVSRSHLAPGDLVFYENHREGIHHVGFYLAPDVILDAPLTGALVRVEPDWSGLWGYGRATLPQRAPVAAPTGTDPDDGSTPSPSTGHQGSATPSPTTSPTATTSTHRHHKPPYWVGPLHVVTPKPNPTPTPTSSEVPLR